jgi:hypothetical protein
LRNIRDNFRKELQLPKNVTSGQGARKRRKYIYFYQLLFLLPIMQQRDRSGNITPPSSANESEPQDITTRNEMGEGSHAKNATYYRQQKKRSKTTYEESLLEIIKEKVETILMKINLFLMSLVPSFKKLNDEQKFVAKVEFLNIMRRITFCQSPCHVSNKPQFQSYSNLPGPSAHTSYIGTLPSIKIPSETHHKVCNDFQHQHNKSIQNPYSKFTPSPQHSTSTNRSTPLAHMSSSDGNSLSPLTDSELYELHYISCKSKCNVYAICRQTQLSTRWYANLLNVEIYDTLRTHYILI